MNASALEEQRLQEREKKEQIAEKKRRDFQRAKDRSIQERERMAKAKQEVIELANAAKNEKLQAEKERLEDNMQMVDLRLKQQTEERQYLRNELVSIKDTQNKNRKIMVQSQKERDEERLRNLSLI